MQSYLNVHVYWSSRRVPEVIQSMHRVPIEFPKLRSEIGFRTLHFLLVIPQSKIKKGKNKMDKRKQDEEKQLRKKYTDAMIRKLLPKNHKYYVLDSECVGLRIKEKIRNSIQDIFENHREDQICFLTSKPYRAIHLTKNNMDAFLKNKK